MQSALDLANEGEPGAEKTEVGKLWFVAAHSWDLVGAKKGG